MPRMPEHKGQGMVFQLPANEAAQFGVRHPWATELGPAMSEHFARGWPGGGAVGRVGSSMGAKVGGTAASGPSCHGCGLGRGSGGSRGASWIE